MIGKKWWAVAVSMLLLVGSRMACAQVSSPAATSPARIVLHCPAAIDVAQGKMLGQTTVVIEGGKIKSVAPGIQNEPGATVIDLPGETCIPGLIDLHVHLSSSGGRRGMGGQDFADAVLRAAYSARKTLLAGFTTVENVGDSNYETVSLRNAINQGWMEGPRIFTAGPAISTSGGHGDRSSRLPIDLQGDPGPAQNIINSPEDAYKAVRIHYKEHVDFIKFMSSGGVMDTGASVNNPQFTLEEAKAIVAAAHDYGFLATTHSMGAEAIRRAVLAGVDSIQHGTFMDDEDIRLMKERGTWYCPTVYANHYVAEQAQKGNMQAESIPKALIVGPQIMKIVSKAYKAGVKFAYGTDTGVFAPGENWRDFPLLVEAGMPPIYAIQMATINAAQASKHEADLGSIAPGKAADIVAVKGDPLQDINLMGKIDFVMKAGVVYKQDGKELVFEQ